MFEWQFLKKDLSLKAVTTPRLMVAIALFLLVSIGTTVYLSGDPNWARWHISYLGEGATSASNLFNYSMWATGILVLALSFSFRGDLERAKLSNSKLANIKPSYIQAGIATMSACVYFVGLFPRSFGVLPHDIFGHVIYFSFLFMFLASPWILPGMSKAFYAVSYVFHFLMLVIFVLYWLGVTDTVYVAEVSTFVFFYVWLSLLYRQTVVVDERI